MVFRVTCKNVKIRASVYIHICIDVCVYVYTETIPQKILGFLIINRTCPRLQHEAPRSTVPYHLKLPRSPGTSGESLKLLHEVDGSPLFWDSVEEPNLSYHNMDM